MGWAPSRSSCPIPDSPRLNWQLCWTIFPLGRGEDPQLEGEDFWGLGDLFSASAWESPPLFWTYTIASCKILLQDLEQNK